MSLVAKDPLVAAATAIAVVPPAELGRRRLFHRQCVPIPKTAIQALREALVGCGVKWYDEKIQRDSY